MGRRRTWLPLGALLLVMGAARSPAALGEPAHPGVRPGEAFTYRLAVGPIEGARARMSIGMPVARDGRRVLAVQGEAETVSLVSLVAPVSAAYQLIVDANTLLPEEVTTVEHGNHERCFHSRLNGRALDLEVVAPSRNLKSKRILPRETRDPLSAYFALRAAPLRDGDHLELDVIDGAALWRARLRVVRRETIRLNEDGAVVGPPQRAIRVEGTLDRIDDQERPVPRVPRRTLECWLSDDATRALLRASFDSTLGRARLELTSYLPPGRAPRGAPPPPRPAPPSGGEVGFD